MTMDTDINNDQHVPAPDVPVMIININHHTHLID